MRRTGRCRALGALAAAALAAAAALPGCVERLLQIRSDPPGARVFVNGDYAGVTPVDVPFTHYGAFDVTLRPENHRSLRRLERIPVPWYEHLLLDLVCEHLVPWTIRDHHLLSYRLEPVGALTRQEEVDREQREARERMRTLEGRAAPAAGKTAGAESKP